MSSATFRIARSSSTGMTVPPAWPTVFSTAIRSTTSTSYGSSDSTSSRARSAVIHAFGPGSPVRNVMPDRTADVISSVLATCAPDRRGHQMAGPVHVQPDADLVGHRAGRHVERGLLAGDLGGALLQPVDGRIVAEPVVADLGVGHGPAHGGGGRGDGVRTEIDAVGSHSRVSIGTSVCRRRGGSSAGRSPSRTASRRRPASRPDG